MKSDSGMSGITSYVKHNPCEECSCLKGESETKVCPFKKKVDCPTFRIFDGLNSIAETPQKFGANGQEYVYDNVIKKTIEILRLFGYKGELRYTETVQI